MRGEIYTLGHRNVQGAAIHPLTGRLWIHEHGDDADDRVIALERGANYGWPAIANLAEKQSGRFPPALHYWTPTIAPSGMAFYTGERLPGWRGDLFLGSLKDQMLVRLKLDGTQIIREERLLKGVLGRIRDVRTGPDGFLYLLVDDRNGKLVRIEAAQPAEAAEPASR